MSENDQPEDGLPENSQLDNDKYRIVLPDGRVFRLEEFGAEGENEVPADMVKTVQ